MGYGRATLEIKHHFHHITSGGHIYPHELWVRHRPWAPGGGSVCAVSLLRSCSPLPHSPCWLFQKEVTMPRRHLRTEEFSTSFLEGRESTWIIWNSSARRLVYSPSIYPFKSFTYISMDSWILVYTLSYNPIFLYCVAQIVGCLFVCLSISLHPGPTRCSRLLFASPAPLWEPLRTSLLPFTGERNYWRILVGECLLLLGYWFFSSSPLIDIGPWLCLQCYFNTQNFPTIRWTLLGHKGGSLPPLWAALPVSESGGGVLLF